MSSKFSTPRHNLYNLQPVTGLYLSLRKFRRRHRFTVVFHHHAARQQLLRQQKTFDRTRQIRRHRLSIGNDFLHGTDFSSPIPNETGPFIPSTSNTTSERWIASHFTCTGPFRNGTCFVSPEANDTPLMIA